MIEKGLFTIALTAAFSKLTMAQDTLIFPKGQKATNVDHVGNVCLKELNEPDRAFNFSISVATFDPVARLDWHTHPGGQILLITEGVGYYHEKGNQKITVRKGDVVKCLPGVEHWNGASPKRGVTYLPTSPAQKGKTIWGRKLSNEEYLNGE